MERVIHRGRIVQECLKQERLALRPVLFQMAWLVAFNDGMLDDREPADIHTALEALETAVSVSSLDLDSPRDEWKQLVASALAIGTKKDTAT